MFVSGQNILANELQSVELNCHSLGSMKLKEMLPNEDIRAPLSDILLLTLPSGSEVKLIRTAGASVRNWTSPSSGITYSQAPTWSKDVITFERNSYGYEKGIYKCSSKW